MGTLVKFEFRKLFRMKSFYICMLIGIAFSALGVVGNLFIGEVTGSHDFTAFKALPTAITSGQIVILLAVFVSLFVCSDFIEGTIKNVISRGFSRTRVYITKYLVLIVAGLIFAILNMATTFVMSAILFGVGSPSGNLLPMMLIQCLLVLSFVSLYQFFAVIFRKNGGSIAVGIVFPIFLNILLMVFPLIFKKAQFDFTMLNVSSCLSAVSDLAVTGKEMGIAVLNGFLYILIFGIAGALISRKREW